MRYINLKEDLVVGYLVFVTATAIIFHCQLEQWDKHKCPSPISCFHETESNDWLPRGSKDGVK